MFYTIDEETLWRKAVEKAYRLRTVRLEASGLRALLYRCPRPLGKVGLVTAAYLGEGGVEGSPRDPRELVAAVEETLRREGAHYALFKTRFPLLLDSVPPRAHVEAGYVSYSLSLEGGPERLWRDALDSKTRNQTRKGLKSGVALRFGGRELLRPFHRVISTVWRDLGTPTHGLPFFDAVVEALGSRAEIVVGEMSGEPVTAALLVASGDTLHDPFAGTLRRVNPQCVNNVLYWRIIERACERGFRSFDMGRSRIGQGTCRFKESWGAVPIPLHYTYFLSPGLEAPRPVTDSFRFATRVWRRLPLGLARWSGPYLIRHLL